jgi:hypothetical protein
VQYRLFLLCFTLLYQSIALSQKQENIAQNYFSIKLHSTNYNISLNFNELQNNFQIQLVDMNDKVVLNQKYAEHNQLIHLL